jgi:thioredoxin-related protein
MTTHTLGLLSLLILLLLPSSAFAIQIELGASYNDVILALGEPDGELSAGTKTILTYGKAQLVLRDKKVTSISQGFDSHLKERVETKSNIDDKRKAGLVNLRGEWMSPEAKKQITQAETRKRLSSAANRSTTETWFTNFAQASALAKKQNKKMLLNFTGSDWCSWCIRLDREVFSQPEFTNYANEHYVLVKLDFPKKTSISQALQKQNIDLSKKYKVRGFPTIVVLNPSGKIHTTSGYVRGGPQAFLNSIK